MKHFFVSLLIVVLFGQISWAGRARIETISQDPYRSALLLDADTGETLFADNADAIVYPASVLKLMVLLVTLDRIEQGTLNLNDMVQVTVEAYKMGGSQVYLDPKEQFPVDDLLYALMVQSANDAAVALATHIGGSKDNFVTMMNQKAEELGMKNTRFYSVHGLPPADGQKVDVTTAQDFAILCRELTHHPEVYKYTGTKVKDFRDGQFIMRNHNHLLGEVEGCDGFKTGYFKAAGFSIAATAKRNGVRLIAIVMGSKDRKVRDARTKELLAKGFAMVPPKPKPAAAAPAQVEQAQKTDSVSAKDSLGMSKMQNQEAVPADEGGSWLKVIMRLGIGAALLAALAFFVAKKKRNKRNKFR
jgi:D-alanyl-D-alanine carboxypeptidase (penicillin-binding protein 5/6)